MASTNPEDRQARLAKMQAAQRNEERRRSFLIIGIAATLAVVLIGVVVAVIVQSESARSEVEAAAAGDIEGVEDDFGELTQNHVESQVVYEQMPPVGGDHLPTWQNCGFYEAPITTEAGVHSLEHGAVWVTYDPELPAEQVEQLRALADENSYLLASPMEDLPSPVVASAWGVQLQLDSVDDERLPVFLVKYLQGEQTPEPGAACTGGLTA